MARAHGLRVHLDGARLFNAAVALGVDVKVLTADADTLTFCLSKGLAAPVGSVVCGDRAFIAEARRARKVVGGGMRQAGVIAAAGIVALEQMVDRLAEDHANAEALAAGLAELPGIQVDEVPVRTNIVYFRITRPDLDAPKLVARLDESGVRMLPLDPRRARVVLNYHVTAADVGAALGRGARGFGLRSGCRAAWTVNVCPRHRTGRPSCGAAPARAAPPRSLHGVPMRISYWNVPTGTEAEEGADTVPTSATATTL